MSDESNIINFMKGLNVSKLSSEQHDTQKYDGNGGFLLGEDRTAAKKSIFWNIANTNSSEKYQRLIDHEESQMLVEAIQNAAGEDLILVDKERDELLASWGVNINDEEAKTKAIKEFETILNKEYGLEITQTVVWQGTSEEQYNAIISNLKALQEKLPQNSNLKEFIDGGINTKSYSDISSYIENLEKYIEEQEKLLNEDAKGIPNSTKKGSKVNLNLQISNEQDNEGRILYQGEMIAYSSLGHMGFVYPEIKDYEALEAFVNANPDYFTTQEGKTVWESIPGETKLKKAEHVSGIMQKNQGKNWNYPDLSENNTQRTKIHDEILMAKEALFALNGLKNIGEEEFNLINQPKPEETPATEETLTTTEVVTVEEVSNGEIITYTTIDNNETVTTEVAKVEEEVAYTQTNLYVDEERIEGTIAVPVGEENAEVWTLKTTDNGAKIEDFSDTKGKLNHKELTLSSSEDKTETYQIGSYEEKPEGTVGLITNTEGDIVGKHITKKEENQNSETYKFYEFKNTDEQEYLTINSYDENLEHFEEKIVTPVGDAMMITTTHLDAQEKLKTDIKLIDSQGEDAGVVKISEENDISIEHQINLDPTPTETPSAQATNEDKSNASLTEFSTDGKSKAPDSVAIPAEKRTFRAPNAKTKPIFIDAANKLVSETLGASINLKQTTSLTQEGIQTTDIITVNEVTLEGATEKYDENGNLIEKIQPATDGTIITTKYSYNKETGILESCSQMYGDKLAGEAKFDKSGKLLTISETLYDENNGEYKITRNSQNMPVLLTYQNGETKTELDISSDIKDLYKATLGYDDKFNAVDENVINKIKDSYAQNSISLAILSDAFYKQHAITISGALSSSKAWFGIEATEEEMDLSVQEINLTSHFDISALATDIEGISDLNITAFDPSKLLKSNIIIDHTGNPVSADAQNAAWHLNAMLNGEEKIKEAAKKAFEKFAQKALSEGTLDDFMYDIGTAYRVMFVKDDDTTTFGEINTNYDYAMKGIIHLSESDENFANTIANMVLKKEPYEHIETKTSAYIFKALLNDPKNEITKEILYGYESSHLFQEGFIDIIRTYNDLFEQKEGFIDALSKVAEGKDIETYANLLSDVTFVNDKIELIKMLNRAKESELTKQIVKNLSEKKWEIFRMNYSEIENTVTILDYENVDDIFTMATYFTYAVESENFYLDDLKNFLKKVGFNMKTGEFNLDSAYPFYKENETLVSILKDLYETYKAEK